MNRCAELLFANPVTPTRPSKVDVVFKGRTRQDTKRALLKYWLQNRASLEMELEEFQRQCAWTSDESIVFQTRSMG